MENGNEIFDFKEIVNKFNDYFVNIGKLIVSEIFIVCKDFMVYFGNLVCNSFYLFLIWFGEIEIEINDLKFGKFFGLLSIFVNIFKLI